MTEGPITPGLAPRVYQPATAADFGGFSAPLLDVPSPTSLVRTPMAGITSDTGAGTGPTGEGPGSAAVWPRGTATGGTARLMSMRPLDEFSRIPARPPTASIEPAASMTSAAGRLSGAACRPLRARRKPGSRRAPGARPRWTAPAPGARTVRHTGTLPRARTVPGTRIAPGARTVPGTRMSACPERSAAAAELPQAGQRE